MTRATLLATGCAALALTLGACSKPADKAEPAAGTPAATSASAGEAMKPTPGQWKMTTDMEGMPAGAMPAVEVCLTADDLKGDANGITTTMDIKATGDFSKRYTVETVMKMEPAAPGAPNPMKMSVVAERVGDC
jgi:hypothetical protein